MKLQRFLLLAVAAMMALTAHAEVKLPAFFMDNMVLQQQTTARIWGTATPKKKVTVTASWSEEEFTAKADKEGKFMVELPTIEAGGPYELTISDGEAVTLKNVMLGEVWICSGQSNMEMPMKGFKNQPVENGNLDAARGTNGDLRLFTVKRNAQVTPVDDVVGEWAEAKPLSIREFSATAYYFGRMVQEELQVPVGLICVAWGGSACEAWMTPEMLAAFPQVTLPASQEEVDKTKQRCPTALWNGMLKPLVGMAMRGVSWYQGCDNWNRAYCQIAPYDYEIITAAGQSRYNSAYLREQQAKVEHMVPNSGMAVLLDVGMERGIHPYDKRTPGERLALHALAKTYGFEGVYCDSPVYKGMEVKGNVVEVSFDRAPMWISCKHAFESKCFELAGEDRVFYPAKAEVKQKKMIVSSEQVPNPVAVRYAFKDWVVGDLYGSDGLPISSFRSDDWADPAPIKQ